MIKGTIQSTNKVTRIADSTRDRRSPFPPQQRQGRLHSGRYSVEHLSASRAGEWRTPTLKKRSRLVRASKKRCLEPRIHDRISSVGLRPCRETALYSRFGRRALETASHPLTQSESCSSNFILTSPEFSEVVGIFSLDVCSLDCESLI